MTGILIGTKASNNVWRFAMTSMVANTKSSRPIVILGDGSLLGKSNLNH